MQPFMDSALRGLEFCFCYIDDILIASSNEEIHQQHLREVFEKLQEFGLVINVPKCFFGLTEVRYLGYMVDESGIRPPSDRVEALTNYPTTDYGSVTKVSCIPDASKTQTPLVNLTIGAKKNDKRPIQWNTEADRAFDECKDWLRDAVQLAHPRSDVPLVLRCDASDVAVGAALDQRVNEQLQPLGFFSRKLNTREMKYKIYDRELLAIYRAKSGHTCDRIARQLEEIGRSSTRIEFVPGNENIVADAYSCIETINMPVTISNTDLSDMQRDDDELKLLLETPGKNSLQLRRLRTEDTDTTVYCDVGGNYICPYVPATLRRKVFDSVHKLSHPSGRATKQQNRFTRWPEAIPLKDITAETIVSSFFNNWVCRFGAPKTITTDRGTQFESALFEALPKLTGSTRIRTTAYHRAVNGIMERWHRSLKSSIKCQEATDWVSVLPTVLLGLRTSFKEDIKTTAAETVFSTTLRLPGEFFIHEKVSLEPGIFVEKFREHMRHIKSTPSAHHCRTRPFAHTTLYTCSHPYKGPYKVLERISDYVFKVNIQGTPETISTERLKPAEDIERVTPRCSNTPKNIPTRPKWKTTSTTAQSPAPSAATTSSSTSARPSPSSTNLLGNLKTYPAKKKPRQVRFAK
ncbi:uncharacterized protein LOC129915178 [Episyrphus balteatus]|uniref:uncharacterized protein LOC129915178 n=1 Tax=Episyrphus balteatus TaxID=286459 RepID=UPI0024860609|nr:uncharacterized protein LOC129915178 [Episyrphus balteatus]